MLDLFGEGNEARISCWKLQGEGNG